ncbi:MAG: MerR family transcriptional regulator [bacterium]|nr:MerR family transcriptional regulator [bacterium]
MMMNTYTSKEISEKTAISIPTLRYYEQIGLLDRVDRAMNGHRRYSDDDVRRIDFLKRLRATGMSISEMHQYVELYRAGDSTLSERLVILEAHRRAIQAQIDILADTVTFLDMKIARYRQQQQHLLEQDNFISEQHAMEQNV